MERDDQLYFFNSLVGTRIWGTVEWYESGFCLGDDQRRILGMLLIFWEDKLL